MAHANCPYPDACKGQARFTYCKGACNPSARLVPAEPDVAARFLELTARVQREVPGFFKG